LVDTNGKKQLSQRRRPEAWQEVDKSKEEWEEEEEEEEEEEVAKVEFVKARTKDSETSNLRSPHPSVI
jgi:hypothetical protein